MKHKIKYITIGIIIILVTWFLFTERQSDLPYRVTGQELLNIKKECKEFAEKEVEELKNSDIGTHQLVGYGYSEYKGFCYAEIIQNFGENDYKLLYNTTEEKKMFVRSWPDNINWYEYDFDRIILGKEKIIDFRAP